MEVAIPRGALGIIVTFLNSRTVLCVLVLHFLCWSADSWINSVLAALILATIVYFYGFGYIVILVYQAASYFSFLIFILEAILRVIFVFALYEIILELVGYHSEDYRKLKRHLQMTFTDFTATSCAWFLNMTTEDGALVLETNDVENLCRLTWNTWYALMICIGLYVAMPEYTKVKKNGFLHNLHLTAMLLVVWKVFESFLWFGWWNSVEFQRASCLFVHYIRNGQDGFRSAAFRESHNDIKIYDVIQTKQ